MSNPSVKIHNQFLITYIHRVVSSSSQFIFSHVRIFGKSTWVVIDMILFFFCMYEFYYHLTNDIILNYQFNTMEWTLHDFFCFQKVSHSTMHEHHVAILACVLPSSKAKQNIPQTLKPIPSLFFIWSVWIKIS